MRPVVCLWLFLFAVCLSSPAQNSDELFRGKGLIDISQQDSTIQVRLIYAYPDNFMGEAVYEGITKAWLRPEAALMLVKAQQLLKAERPDLSLIVYDAARPMSVQRRMWALVRGTDKTNYVGNPANGGGLHNYGMAVDVSLVNGDNIPLPMGSAVDFFGKEAHTTEENYLVESGKISNEEYHNRLLLRRIMRKAGFRTIPYEWWHFNACSRAEARERYPVIE